MIKGTPSKKPRAGEFQRTPLPTQRRSLGSRCSGVGSPIIAERWTEGGATPISHVSVTPVLAAPHCASPQVTRGPGAAAGMMSPLACSASFSAATPLAVRGQASTPSYCPVLPGLSPSSACSGCGQAMHRLSVCSTPSASASQGTPSFTTPCKIMTISTPLRPCARQRAKEMQDDINQAVEEHSVPLLRAALQRRHACPGEHALHEAVRQAHTDAMRLLLQNRAEPNARCPCLERDCQVPLQLAVTGLGFIRPNERFQAVELLLRAGACPGVRRSNAEANTPLHDAIRRGDFDVASLLLRHAADPNLTNGFGETPLHLVLHQEGGFLPIALLRSMVEALLAAGASPLVCDSSGLPPAQAATDAELRQLLARWSAWWRCRTLAWVHSRGRHPFRQLMPEVLLHLASFF